MALYLKSSNNNNDIENNVSWRNESGNNAANNMKIIM